MFLTSFISLLILAMAAAGEYPWWNYPGLELWKFLNLFLFVLVMFFLLRRRVSDGFRARMGMIKAELERARVERDQAVAKLGEVQGRFEKLDQELANIKAKSAAEAAAERKRIQAATDQEIAKLREQASRELDSAGKAARHDLRQFAAQESVRIAEQILQKEIGSADDERLMKLNVEELRRTNA